MDAAPELPPKTKWKGRQALYYWLAPAMLAVLYLTVHLVILIPRLATEPGDFGAFYYPATRAILAGQSPFSVIGLIYPPLLPVLLLPLGLLPYLDARVAWFVASHLLVAAAGLWTWRAIGGDRIAALAVLGAWATSGALHETFSLGQINALLLLLVVAFIWPRATERWSGPSALGLAIALKLWPGVLLIPDALRLRWRRVVQTLGVAALLLGVPWLVVAGLLSGPVAPPRAGFWTGSPAALNVSVPGVALRLLDRPQRGVPMPTQWITGHNVTRFHATPQQNAVSLGVTLVLFGMGTGVLAAAMRRGVRRESEALLSAAFIALALVSAPVVWTHYHTLQLPGVAILAERSMRRRAWWYTLMLGVVCVVTTWAAPVLAGPYRAHFGFMVVYPLLLWLLTTAGPVGAVIIALLLFAELRRDGPGSAQPAMSSRRRESSPAQQREPPLAGRVLHSRDTPVSSPHLPSPVLASS